MLVPGGRRIAVVFSVLATVPGAAAGQPLEPSAIGGARPVTLAVVSFLLVGLFGGAFLYWRAGLVDSAVDDTMGRPVAAVVYGLGAYAMVLFGSFYTNNVMTQLGLSETPLGALTLVVLVGGVLVLGGFGHAVVGMLLTDLWGERRPWEGLALAGALSGVCWLVLPGIGAVAAWIFLAAVGVGGPARTWAHNSRTAESEAGD